MQKIVSFAPRDLAGRGENLFALVFAEPLPFHACQPRKDRNMARKPIFSSEEIIQAGKALEADKGGEVSSWEIHKHMGSVGNLGRVEGIWMQHLATREKEAELHQPEVPLPTVLQQTLESGLARLKQGVETLLLNQRSSLLEEHQRQLALQHRDHAEELSKAKAEAERYRQEVTYLRSLLEADDEVEDEPE